MYNTTAGPFKKEKTRVDGMWMDASQSWSKLLTYFQYDENDI